MKRGTSEKTPHRWHTPKSRRGFSLSWMKYCWRCGLMYLKNDATEKAIRAGCLNDTVMDVTES